MVTGPKEPPPPDLANPPDPVDSNASTFLHVVGLLGFAGFIAFAATPILCVLTWLYGYGPGGMNELQSGYPIRGMMNGSVLLAPAHFLSLLLPRHPNTKVIGYAVSASLVLLMSFYWFIAAAAIAGV